MPITTSREQKRLLRSIVDIAKALGIEVVAEGVETQEQLQFVISEGCSEAQGWIFSQPIPSNKVDALIQERNHPQELVAKAS